MTGLARNDAEELIHRECGLLDSGALEEWLRLFTDDATYWLPITDGEPEDAKHVVSIAFDDKARMEERVFRTLHTPVLDQNPRSRTIHFVSNVEVSGHAGNGDTRVLCNEIIAEMRPGGDQQIGLNRPVLYAARCEFRLRKVADGWRISLKKVLLINSDQALPNLAFVL